MIQACCRRVAEDGRFQHFVLGIILFNGVVMGLETSSTLMASYGRLFGWVNLAVQAVFVLEIAVRLLAHWPRILQFFRDGWSCFDFAVVAISLLPEVGPFATVARLARVLRVARVLSSFPELRLIVSTMLRSIPSMGHVILLLGLLLYVYGILGFWFFHAHDPRHWGTLGTSIRSLFQILTLEGWVDIQAASLAVNPLAWIYYASFIVIAVFVVVNLFIAVVINNLEEAKKELRAALDVEDPRHEGIRRIGALKEALAELEGQLRSQCDRAQRAGGGVEREPGANPVRSNAAGDSRT